MRSMEPHGASESNGFTMLSLPLLASARNAEPILWVELLRSTRSIFYGSYYRACMIVLLRDIRLNVGVQTSSEGSLCGFRAFQGESECAIRN